MAAMVQNIPRTIKVKWFILARYFGILYQMNLQASEFIPHTVFESDMDTDGYLNTGGTVSFCSITLQVFKSFSHFVSTDKLLFFFFP